MAAPPEFSTDGGAVIELDEEIEGDEIGSRNYRFSKIGESVPVSTDGTVEFEPQSLPSQPLAISERFRLLFVAHPQGFYVVRTKDVMASAEEIKEKKTGRSIQELSLVDVPIGKVSILALSADDSLLAATVASHVHFFAVSALLHKEQKPSYSVSVDDSICIKDVCLARKVAKDYLILSSNGKLYHGSGQAPLVYLMEAVDSVDWSIKGNHIAVAKQNVVSILSSHFKEKSRFFLSFQSVIGDSDASQAIRVDSIRWIRPDCIAVGCFQINDDGEEENYIVQVITSRGRRFTDESSKPSVLTFSNVFMDFCSDAVPTRNGRHLFLSYLDLYGLAFVAIRNLSRQVALFSWQENGNNEAAMIEILDDAWILHIDSQDNDDENVLVGLSVDKVSQNENLRFTLGNEEREVSPCCVIICLTIDGRISVFHHFTSNAGALASPEGCTSSEEDDASQVSVKHQPSQISSAGTDEIREPTCSASQSHQVSRIVVEKTSPIATTASNLSPSFNVDIRPRDKNASDNMGHNKPLLNSQTLKVDDPEKAILIVQNQDSNAHNKSVTEAKHSKGFFSGNMASDISRQPVSNYTLLGSNVEALHKALPPENTPSLWSLTRSNARDDASETSAGMFLSLSSGEVDCSEGHTLRSPRGVQKHPTDLKEKPLVNFTNPGQTAMTAQGTRKSQPAFVGSQVPLGNTFASGKSFQSDIKKEINATSTPPLAIHFAQHASKQFGNVEEMAKKLDTLLEGIEGKAGFIDASITSQTNSVIELEEGIWALSDRCRVQRGLINKQQRELQLLLDLTVEVLVRKVYMKGIFEQATDSKYWELWNRQKLNSELELKQRRILELNQELTNKLIELERHFNSLEFNKFRENEGTQRNQRPLQNWHGHSRQIQSLRSLHNTMTAQLAAAEQLSGCLSNQMAALSIQSSGKHDVKRQLFESIGLPYVGDSEISPARNRTYDTPANKKNLSTSSSIAAKGQPRRNQSSFAKGCEPETARHRRDSFDHSWASFDPPKTTLKRIIEEGNEKGSSNRSLLKISKQYFSPQSQKKPEVANSALSNASGAFQNHYQSKGLAETSAEQFTKSPSTSSYLGTAGSTKGFSALQAPSVLVTRAAQNSGLGAFTQADEKSKSSLAFTGKSYSLAASESKHVQQSNTTFHPLPSTPAELPEQSLTSPLESTESADGFEFEFTNSTSWDHQNTKTVSRTPLFDAKNSTNLTSASSSSAKVSEKGSFSKNSEKASRPNDKVSASSPLQSVLASSFLSSNNYPSPASLVSKSISSSIFPATPKSSEINVVVKQEGSEPQPSVTSSMTFPPLLPSLTYGSSLSSVSSSSICKSELPTSSQPSVSVCCSKTESISEIQAKVDIMPSKTETGVKIETSASQPEFPVSTSSLKHSASPALPELSTNSKFESQEDLGGSSKNLSGIKVEMSSATEAPPSLVLSNEGMDGSMRNVIPNSSHEEDMEEEVSETEQTTGFIFANLDGFGIGSIQNSTTPKANPFCLGVVNSNTAFATSPYMMSGSSGELFRPASFSFQSPQPLQSTTVNFSGGFSSGGSPGQVGAGAGAGAGFGKPAQIGSGQQALGSVLGSFGQSRQIGSGVPGSNAASPSGFGSGFTGISAGGFGFATAPSGGGFAGLAAAGGGFAAAATAAGGGFAAAAAAVSGGGGGGGFGGFSNQQPSSGGGFGGFSNQQPSSGGFSAFSGSSGATGTASSQLFTQMRR